MNTSLYCFNKISVNMNTLPKELHCVIASFLNKVSYLRNFRDTSKYFSKLLPIKRCKEDNDIAILFQLYPKANWSKHIATCPSISMNMVKFRPDFDWDLQLLYENPNIDPYSLPKWTAINNNYQHPHSYNPKPNLQFIEDNFDNYKWSAYMIVINAPITPEVLSKYPKIKDKLQNQLCRNSGYKLPDLIELGIPINLARYSENPNVTSEEVITPLPEGVTVIRQWNWFQLSRILKVDDIDKYSHLSWRYETLSYNPIITRQFVISNKDKKWNWPGVSSTLKMKWSEIHKIINFNYSNKEEVYWLCQEAYGILEFVIEHPEINWNTEPLLYNDNISFDDILKHKYLFKEIWHRDIRWDVVRDNSNINWGFRLCVINHY